MSEILKEMEELINQIDDELKELKGVVAFSTVGNIYSQNATQYPSDMYVHVYLKLEGVTLTFEMLKKVDKILKKHGLGGAGMIFFHTFPSSIIEIISSVPLGGIGYSTIQSNW